MSAQCTAAELLPAVLEAAGVAQARSLLAEGRPLDALNALMRVVESQVGGDKDQALAYLQSMMARAQAEAEAQADAEEHDGELWYPCDQYEEGGTGSSVGGPMHVDLGEHESVLAEQGSGREGILLAAAADPSSMVCAHCGALIPLRRREAHMQIWCPVVGAGMPDDASDG
jgi:hypothetical protein